MLSEQAIETTGSILKEEHLINLEHNIMPNTLVLESSHPFPGYHGSNLPEKPLPNFIYLITETKYDGEDILRLAKRIKRSFPENFDASFGSAEIYSLRYYFIRAKNLDCFSCIRRLQEAFYSGGIRFMKKKRINAESLIKLQKYFSLTRIDDNLYKDNDDPLLYYFGIEEKPDWALFKKITLYIRSNLDYYSFDAALGALYLKELADVVRIYGKDLNKEQLQFIYRKYQYELAHPDHLA